jgi:FolB domain-containing protein
MFSTLHIKQLSLSVNLGWRNKERDQEQSVFLDMIIRFQEPPQACKSDDLDDTQCYATLITHIRQTIDAKHYKLVEYLTADIYQIALSVLPSNTKLQIAITKFPQIGGLNGGVTFHYGDF